MARLDDQTCLLAQQYHDASRFNARVALHQRFSTNPYGWLRWVFDQFDLPPQCQLLELGCGPAYLWQANADRLPPGWTITLSDLSPGMLAEAQRTVATIPHAFSFAQIDAQAIPLPPASVDAVIANHMLYHLPDRERAYAEVRRVLRSGGRFFAATNGATHLQELRTIAAELDPPHTAWATKPANSFALETGGAELARWFAHVDLLRYPDGLIVTEAAPLVDFVLSMTAAPAVDPARRVAYIATIQQQLDHSGPMVITKDAGLFRAV